MSYDGYSPTDQLIDDVRQCALESMTETEFLAWLRREHVAYAPKWDRSAGRVVSYSVRRESGGSWIDAPAMGQDMELSSLRAKWQQTMNQEIDAQAWWDFYTHNAERHGSRPAERASEPDVTQRQRNDSWAPTMTILTVLALVGIAIILGLLFIHRDTSPAGHPDVTPTSSAPSQPSQSSSSSSTEQPSTSTVTQTQTQTITPSSESPSSSESSSSDLPSDLSSHLPTDLPSDLSSHLPTDLPTDLPTP